MQSVSQKGNNMNVGVFVLSVFVIFVLVICYGFYAVAKADREVRDDDNKS